MKQLAIISGKGGTGKTTVAGSLAALNKGQVFADCDVDAANLHLVMDSKPVSEHKFYGMARAKVSAGRCEGCGLCAAKCKKRALERKSEGYYEVNMRRCEGCGMCKEVCPHKAIEMIESSRGSYFVSETIYGKLVHAELMPGEENSGKLVSEVRQKAREVAESEGAEVIIIDGSPGIGCAVIASVTGCDHLLAVTEPTVSGIHDLMRVTELAGHFKLGVSICINKFDVNMDNSEEIFRFAEAKGFEVVGKIPYDRRLVESQIKSVPAVEYCGGEIREIFADMQEKLMIRLNRKQ